MYAKEIPTANCYSDCHKISDCSENLNVASRKELNLCIQYSSARHKSESFLGNFYKLTFQCDQMNRHVTPLCEHPTKKDNPTTFSTVYTVEKGKISYFGLARNLIRHLISPNRDDLSYSARIFISGQQDWVSCQTHSLWLENADQCRRHTGRSSIAMLFSWTMPSSADISLRL